MMKGRDGKSGLEIFITERQRHGHYRRGGPGSPLGDHGQRRFDRDDPAVRGFIVARASPHVYDELSIAQGRNDQPLNTGIWTAGPRITVADSLVQLFIGT